MSDEFDRKNDDAFRLEEIIRCLKTDFDCTIIKSYSYEDALDVFHSRADIGCVVIDWGIPDEVVGEKMKPAGLVHAIRKKNKLIPIILLTDKMQTTSLPNDYGMVRTGAKPVYMVPRRNHRGVIGPVRLSEFTDKAIVIPPRLPFRPRL